MLIKELECKALVVATAFTRLLTVLALGILGTACATKSTSSHPVTPFQPLSERFTAYSSDSELQTYLQDLEAWSRAESSAECRIQSGEHESLSTEDEAGELLLECVIVTGRMRTESITNNQVEDVDEGDIVKHLGRFLIVLRQGKLYSIDIGTAEVPQLELIDTTGVQTGPETYQAWYDEMLVHNNTIVVLGYSYATDNTELAFFELGSYGQFSHRQTYHLKSFDYYSGENYASRLVDGNLIFYIPMGTGQIRNTLNWPEYVVQNADYTEIGKPRPLFESPVIYAPIQHSRRPKLHTILTCPIEAEEFSCTATSVLGPESETYYVSREHLYLWISEHPYSFDLDSVEPMNAIQIMLGDQYSNWGANQASMLYRIPLDHSSPTAHLVKGSPENQFSLYEKEGSFYALTKIHDQNSPYGWHHWNLELLTFPTQDFETSSIDTLKGDYFKLPESEESSYFFVNRFSQDRLIYSNTVESEQEEYASKLVIQPLDLSAHDQLDLKFGVSRIEPLGNNIFLSGRFDNLDLAVKVFDPENSDIHSHPLRLSRTVEAEWLSHGFNSTEFQDGYLAGLPIRDIPESRKTRWFYEDLPPAKIQYFYHSDAKGLSIFGDLAGEDNQIVEEENCDYSCVDWYGMARPIFIGNRIIALVGDELIEANASDFNVYEVNRLNINTE